MKHFLATMSIFSMISSTSFSSPLESLVQTAEESVASGTESANNLFTTAEKSIKAASEKTLKGSYSETADRFYGLYTPIGGGSSGLIRSVVRSDDGTVQEFNFNLSKTKTPYERVSVAPSGQGIVVHHDSSEGQFFEKFQPFTANGTTFRSQMEYEVRHGDSINNVRIESDPGHGRILEVMLKKGDTSREARMLAHTEHGNILHFNVTTDGRVRVYSTEGDNGIWRDEYIMGKDTHGNDVLLKQNSESTRLSATEVADLGLLSANFKKIDPRRVAKIPAGGISVQDNVQAAQNGAAH